MTKLILVSALFMLSCGPLPLSGQTLETDQEIALRLQTLASGEKILSWTGQANHTYFFQASHDLNEWTWAPNIELGIANPMSYEVDGPTDKGFFRLIRTSQTAADLDLADFDGDQLTNLEEITPRPRPGGNDGISTLNSDIQTSPLDPDTDQDGLNDKWEQDHGFDPTDNGIRNINNGSNGDTDQDGLTNASEQRLRTLPNNSDSDGDGTSDGDELKGGTDPTNGSDFPVHIMRMARAVHGGDDLAEEELSDDRTCEHVVWHILDGGEQANVSNYTYEDSHLLSRMLNDLGNIVYPDEPEMNTNRFSRSMTLEGSSGFYNQEIDNGINSEEEFYEVELSQEAVWIEAPPSPVEKKHFFLKVSQSAIYADTEENFDPVTGEFIEVEREERVENVTITTPPDKRYSERYDLTFPVDMTTVPGNDGVQEILTRLFPVEVESMDRYLSGSISESMIESFGGESKFGLVFRNPSSGETYSFNKLSEAHIYDDPFGATDEDEDKFLSNSEIAAWANGPSSASKELTQDVVFYRKEGKLHFRTLFDQAGAIEIGLIKDSQEIGKIDWTLKLDAQIADLLETVDSILSGNYDDGGGIVVAAMHAGLSEGDINALQSAAAGIQSSSSSGGGGFLCRNLTIKVNIPTWEALKDKFEEGARKAGAAVDRAITIATFAGKGFCEGAWLGVKDDATSLVELGKMILNPAETAKTFYEGFKVLIELDLEGWKNAGKSLAQSFLEKGNEGVGEWGEPNALDVASYLVGFTSGFITEQIAVTYVTAGILQAGNVGAKIGQFIRKASQGLSNGLAETTGNLVRRQAMKAKNSVFRRFSQDVLSTEDVKKLKHMLQELELLCPL